MSLQSALLLGLALMIPHASLAGTPPLTTDKDAATITVVGILQTGVVAIGGETTGLVIRSQGRVWELEFGQNSELRKSAETWNDTTVRVEGRLEHRTGVEVQDRWIVSVETMMQIPK
jgi:hypothetical protein